MKTIIQSPDFTASKALLEFVQVNANKLTSFSDQLSECRVLLKLNKSDEKENKICEMKFFVPGENFFASKSSHSFEDATVKAIDAVKHQLARWKEK
jgi:putative sigma-54 modulation protein